MAKVFRPYNIQGNNSIVDWETTNPYGTQAISEITDPDGATAGKEITSIPSPFARIDLVKSAFKEVVDMVRKVPNYERLGAEQIKSLIENGGEKRPTIFHKMVSDSLDVGEIFFNYDRFCDKFDILVWDREQDLDTNTIFGSTLNKFLISDSEGIDSYNFRKMKRIYMLNYKGEDRPSDMNIVGATSPATLFFSSANDASYIANHVAFGEDKPFDEAYNPLFRRDFAFQKYLFAFRKAYDVRENFSRDFPEVNAYLDITYRCLDSKQKGQIDSLNANSIDGYEIINVGDRGQDRLEVLDVPFHKKSSNTSWKSDFEIRSEICKEEKMPLVLPVEAGNTYASLTYTTDRWGTTNHAEYYVDNGHGKHDSNWKNRRLPVVNEAYPYLTISDFLSYDIVRMPYELNSANFYDGGYKCTNGEDTYSYLLPLTDVFFKFFTVNDLMSEVALGKKMFEMQEAGYGVKVILRIPIQRGYVEYTRNYNEGMAADMQHNDGALADTKLGLGVMPLIRFPENVDKNYRIAFFDRGKMDAKLTCYDGTSEVEAARTVRAAKDLSGRGCSHESYMLTENFDRIKVSFGEEGEIVGYIIPKFKTEYGNTEYMFAVDFGTTNTHIEYCTNARKSPVAFNISKSERQLIKMHTKYSDPDIRLAFEQDFIPETIGEKDDLFSFPMRTVYAERVDIDYAKTPMPLCDGNIPFLYERDFTPLWNNIKTELKWGGVHERLLEMHLETIFILMRNKVVLNNGNLPATKVIWFYPASMTLAKVNQFKRIWKEAYEKYFGTESNRNIISISESKAPYLHFIKTQGAADEIVTIDVGGGTTDVFVVEEQQDKMLLSFRYASNAVFGDAYNSNPSKNGFVYRYMKTFKEVLENNELLELVQALSQIEEQQKSSDIVAFLFSLVGDKVKNNASLDFLRKLCGDDRMRYVFIIFYGSIIYFIANTMKAKGLKKPKTIAFSGNGAKTINILSDDYETIGRFAKLIFDGVYGDEKGTISVMMEKNPKIATCKGGIEDPKPQPYDDINNIKTIFVGNEFEASSDNKLTYADIDNNVKNQVLDSVNRFFEFLFDLHKRNNDFLVNYLAADNEIFNTVKEFCLGEEGRQVLEISLSKGLQHKREVDKVNDDTLLEETLFFYPLVGLLHDLAYKIAKQ